MHELKDKWILQILVQEPLKSGLWLRRYGKKKFQGPISNFWKVADLKQRQGFCGKWWTFSGNWIYF
jgi:hypothetical protein